MNTQTDAGSDAVAGQVERPVRPVCYMAPKVVEKLKAKAPDKCPNYGATTTVTIAPAFADDAPLYDQAALDAAVAAERERCRTALRIAREGYASEAATGQPVLPQWRERALALIDDALKPNAEVTGLGRNRSNDER